MPRKKKNLDNFIIKGDVGEHKEDLDKKTDTKDSSKEGKKDVKSASNIKEKKVKKTAVKKSDKKSEKKSDEVPDQTVAVEKKEKSKRGRKPKQSLETPVEPIVKIPKKRGRKPKPKTEEQLQALKEPKVLKKRGRKPKERYGYVVPNVPDVANEEEAVILHLPINTAMLDIESSNFGEKDLLEYNPVMEEPQGYLENSNFQSPFETLEIKEKEKVKVKESLPPVTENITTDEEPIVEEVDTVITTEVENVVDVVKSVEDVHLEFGQKKKGFPINEGNIGKQQTFTTLQNFKESNRKKTLPKSTSIFCWWCCHGFDNEPCVLPTNLVMDEYQVIGCFCSPECAAAYNHESFRQHEERLQYSLLNTLYKRFAGGEQIPIKLAPPKICLRIFGGNLSIEEFRENCHNYYQEFTVINPPMVSIIPQIEENQSNLILKKTKYIPLDKSRVDKATEDLRLHRNKPLSESVNTLENCMKLSYQREET